MGVGFSDIRVPTMKLYRVRGRYVPSVSEVLSTIDKRHYDEWRKRVGDEEANRINRRASHFGSQVHRLASSIARRTYDPIWEDEELHPFGRAIKEFMENHVEEVLQVEGHLASSTLGFGGTPDLYCRLFGGETVVVDWKTGPSLTREHGLQCSAYKLLVEDSGRRCDGRIVVRIKKEEGKHGEFYVRKYEDHTESEAAFRGLVAFWNWSSKNKLMKLTKNGYKYAIEV